MMASSFAQEIILDTTDPIFHIGMNFIFVDFIDA